MTRTDAIVKTKKLLALGNSPNEHEATLAMSRAAEIIAKYKLDFKTLDCGTRNANLCAGCGKRAPRLTKVWDKDICDNCCKFEIAKQAAYAEARL